jgi:hypothetical protein
MTSIERPDPAVASGPTRLRAAIRAVEATAKRLATGRISRHAAVAAVALGLVGVFLLPVALRQFRVLGVPGKDAALTGPSSGTAWRPDEEAAGVYQATAGKTARTQGLDRQGARPATLPASVGPGGNVTADLAWGRRIIRRATLEMESADVERSLARLAEVVEAAGGYVAGTDAQTDGAGTVRARVTAHVPPDRFARVLGELDGVGRVTTRRIGGEDVSEEFVDLEARVRNLERHEAQLVSFMARAQKVTDLLALESEIARVRGEIERLQGRVRFLRARTEMATIQVNLGRALVPGPADSGLARVWTEIRVAFHEAWLAAFRATAEALVLLVRVSPLMVLALAGWTLFRRWARRGQALTS